MIVIQEGINQQLIVVWNDHYNHAMILYQLVNDQDYNVPISNTMDDPIYSFILSYKRSKISLTVTD
jgi:hypothetical protein